MFTIPAQSSKTKGFTLIEILLAIGILAILATAAIIAINPARQFAEARNTQRWNDVHAIMNAVYQYAVEHKGKLPNEAETGGAILELCVPDAVSCSGVIGMHGLTDSGTYLTQLPIDPSCPDACTPYSTGYFIGTNAEGRFVIQAPHSELGEMIELVQ